VLNRSLFEEVVDCDKYFEGLGYSRFCMNPSCSPAASNCSDTFYVVYNGSYPCF